MLTNPHREKIDLRQTACQRLAEHGIDIGQAGSHTARIVREICALTGAEYLTGSDPFDIIRAFVAGRLRPRTAPAVGAMATSRVHVSTGRPLQYDRAMQIAAERARAAAPAMRGLGSNVRTNPARGEG